MPANRSSTVGPVQAVPTCPQLLTQVRACIEPVGADLSRTGRNRVDLPLCQHSWRGHAAPVHLRKLRFDLSRTGQDSSALVLVKLSRTGQDRFHPGSRRTVPLSLSIGEGTGPSPTER